jgi:uncharacterized protein
MATMSPLVVGLIAASALATAVVSGIFGMAGGMLFMAVLVALLPVASAMIVHGIIQLASNGYRAYLWRAHIHWRVLARYGAGTLLAVALLTGVSWRPDKQLVQLLIGVVSLSVWVPRRLLELDAQKRFQAELAGAVVQAINTIAGVSGPLPDMFFISTDMTRHQIVATKAATQVLAHSVKIWFWSTSAIAATGLRSLPPWWLFVVAIPASMAGTTLGAIALDRISDASFKRWMKWLVTFVGVIMFLRAARLF